MAVSPKKSSSTLAKKTAKKSTKKVADKIAKKTTKKSAEKPAKNVEKKTSKKTITKKLYTAVKKTTATKNASLTNKKNETTLRKVNAKEIKALLSQGCTSENWENVFVCNVDIFRIKDVNFLGTVCISNLNGYVKYHEDVSISAAIKWATLIDVTIKGNVYINNIGAFISNYTIEENVIIENVGTIYTKGERYFGNGTSVATIIEGGGRSVRIYNRLDSHTAYILAMYREKTLMQEKINNMIDDYTKTKFSTVGIIGHNAKITSARLIRNTHIDPFARVENSDEISNTTIISTEECPSYIGSSVIIKDSIILKGAFITDNTMINKSFVGEGVKLSRQFSCEDSLLFANCEGQHGEAFSIFAAPYTVTHHKATLLIASHYSFFNAGSGTNQSNHMYKLGPYHHGFMERGCRTGSNSYILWPSRIGAFTTVLGSHYDHIDTSDFPFSYILEHKEHKTRLLPAFNLFGIGICRDQIKWKERDRRVGNKKDFVIFDVFTPYTVIKMIKAEEILFELTKENIAVGNVEEFFAYKKMYIKKSSLPKYIGLYTLAIDLYLHDSLLERIQYAATFDEIEDYLKSDHTNFHNQWVDIAGLITTKERVDNIVWALENDQIKDVKDLSDAWKKVYDLYKEDEWAWIAATFYRRHAINVNAITESQLKSLLDNHKTYLREAITIFENDVRKEFSMDKQVSYGIDDPLVRQEDFNAVRGTVDDNTFVKNYRNSTNEKLELIDNVIGIIDSSY